MPDLKINWDPTGISVDTLSSIKFLHASDGDTPNISVSVRMLSIDAPEIHYPGRTKPSKHDETLSQLADWIVEGSAPIEDGLAAYMHPRLATGNAGTRQLEQGEEAEAFFIRLLDHYLKKPSGAMRSLFIRTADQTFDAYGRLLAYVSPKYTREELDNMTRWQRSTFNLMLVRGGWASLFMIYPSLPSILDLEMMQVGAREAMLERRGYYQDPLHLTGYEFRMAIKLHKITKRLKEGEHLTPSEQKKWRSRSCVDMSTAAIVDPEDYYRIPPYNRLFIWPQDRTEAIEKLNLIQE